MKPRIYVDTSVIGGYFDKEFADATQQLFELVRKGEIIIVYSEITEDELFDAPKNVRDFFDGLPKNQLEIVELTEQANQLADTYISEKVVGKTSRSDCLHIALATINRVDILVSWNFKHIVNIGKIRGYNSVNLKLGYPTLEIRTPKEILSYED
ncbi:MAG: type II toxin-antitoxin system VapC family toxin [Bacteroidia bacterium]|nr:type II toxin-antitoxin system VapC family toxin [Bacteroidia bacterium]